jgi:hypothetical protein
MLIRSFRNPPGGIVHEIDGTEYHFKSEDDDPKKPAVCDVSEPEHVARFLSIKEGFMEEAVAKRKNMPATPTPQQIRDRSKPDQHADVTDQKDPRTADEEESLRVLYLDMAKKPPHHKWDIPTLKAKIEELKQQAKG